MSGFVVVTTVGDESQAITIAREIVARRHAACVNIIPGIRSVYRWKGKICRDGEHMLIIKTLESEYQQVMETIHELHRYELPEVLAFSVADGSPAFLAWLGESVDKSADFSDEEERAFDFDDTGL